MRGLFPHQGLVAFFDLARLEHHTGGTMAGGGEAEDEQARGVLVQSMGRADEGVALVAQAGFGAVGFFGSPPRDRQQVGRFDHHGEVCVLVDQGQR